MDKKILILLIIFILISPSTQANKKEYIKTDSQIEKIVYVDSKNTEGPWNGTINNPYKKINDALKNITENTIIYVSNGTYFENIIIDKKIILKGESKNNTIIDGIYNSKIIKITENKTIIKNVTIRNTGGYKDDCGIKIESKENKIENIKFYRTKIGLFIKNSEKNEIKNCSFHKNGEGIQLFNSKNDSIKRCILGHNSIGIQTYYSKKTYVKNCYFHSNGIALLSKNSEHVKINTCNISNNCVNLGGIYIKNSRNCSIKNNIFRHNGAGVSIYNSENISILNSSFIKNTHFAVSLRTASKNIIIEKCNIINNLRYGFYIEKNNICKISNCNIENNYLYGVFSKYSICIARNNYWGSIFGPSFIQIGENERVKWILKRIKYFPWKIKKIDNIGSQWSKNPDYLKDDFNDNNQTFLSLPGEDTDQDGVPDWWENKYDYNPNNWDDHRNLDPDNDGLNNFEECYTDKWGSNPYVKDIFLEIDWMETKKGVISNKPSEEMLQKIIENFKKQNISLHIDLGQLGGGELVPYCQSYSSYSKLRDLYWDYFLHNDLNNPRKGIFRYCIVCSYCPDLNFPFIGWYNLDFYAISLQWLKQSKPLTKKDDLLTGAILHHLGHTLGMISGVFRGIDNIDSSNPLTLDFWRYSNYKSCMNYRYKYQIFNFSNGDNGKNDFNDWDNLDFYYFKNSDFRENNIKEMKK